MSAPQEVLDALGADLEALDRLAKAIYRATDELSDAEEAWEALLDLTIEALKEDMAADGRKGDPAEHYAVSTCRRQHRAEWMRYRRAKRDLERLQALSQVRRQVCSGRQSELAALRDESRAPTTEPAWSRQQDRRAA